MRTFLLAVIFGVEATQNFIHVEGANGTIIVILAIFGFTMAVAQDVKELLK